MRHYIEVYEEDRARLAPGADPAAARAVGVDDAGEQERHLCVCRTADEVGRWLDGFTAGVEGEPR